MLNAYDSWHLVPLPLLSVAKAGLADYMAQCALLSALIKIDTYNGLTNQTNAVNIYEHFSAFINHLRDPKAHPQVSEI